MTATSSAVPGAAVPSPPGDGPRAERPVRGLRRLAVHPAVIVAVGAAAFLLRIGMDGTLNTDVFWHLASGQWMLAHHRVLRHDVLTYTVFGRRWVNAEWGFDVLLAWGVRNVGGVTYWVLGGGAVAATLLVGFATWRRRGASNLWAAVVAIVVFLPLSIGVAVRPQDLSYLLFAVELLLLALAREQRRWLWALPPLLLVWANLHGSFLAGVGLVGIEAVLATVVSVVGRWRPDPGLGRVRVGPVLRARDAWATLLGVAAAASVNPHGPYLFLYDLRVTSAPQLASIEEWQPPDFHSATVMITVAIPILVVLVALFVSRSRIDAFDLVLWFGLLVFTLRAVRFDPYLGLAAGNLLAGVPALRRETIRPSLLAWPLAALLAVSVLALPHPPPGTPTTKGALANPVQAVAWLGHRRGRVFSTYAWNDYLDHVGIPVFVDGRTDLYFGTGILTDYLDVSGLTVTPGKVLDRFDVRWVLWPAGQPLSVYLSHDPRWRLVRRFHLGLVFERRSPVRSPT